MTDYFHADDGARLAYDDRTLGQGGPVLLCLSGLTRTMEDFRYMLPHLSGVRVVRMDYRGRGASDFTGAESYTVPREAQDAIQLMDHLGIDRAAVLGTSRGGLIGMYLAATSKDRLAGLCLNDVGPKLEMGALHRILDYVGRNPAARTLDQLARALPSSLPEFEGVPESRWQEEAALHYRVTPEGLRITYDPALREAFKVALPAAAGDAWPLFDAAEGLPLALIRGGNSDLLSPETAGEMRRRRPDMIFAEVPGRGHIPFLDEPEALAALRAFIAAL
ncbi:alpha/beta fold hydrolase [Acidimangrovimonas sediminis]|uniref:alpha/beta fold hydrolase n=1 Tax=Acidimangrovimonas sediminis TaxID=2056283 RepID=UPI000C801F3D|nr:alpha/beta hydrolase [Acidimangrovimonas sediminis]